MMILYQYPGGDGLTSISPPCLKVEMALRRIGEPYRTVNCTSRSQTLKVSVTGRLPVLETDGQRIPDSIDILDALEQRFPQSDLWPRDPSAHLRDRLWDHFANDYLYFIGFYLRWVPTENRQRTAAALVGRAPFYVRWVFRGLFLPTFAKRAYVVGIGGKSLQGVLASFDRGMAMAAAGLEGGAFLQGRDRPGRGDLACASLMAQAGYQGTMPDVEARLRAHPKLLDHMRRVFEACSMEPPRWLVT